VNFKDLLLTWERTQVKLSDEVDRWPLNEHCLPQMKLIWHRITALRWPSGPFCYLMQQRSLLISIQLIRRNSHISNS